MNPFGDIFCAKLVARLGDNRSGLHPSEYLELYQKSSYGKSIMLKIKIIYDQGTAKEVEDGFVVNPPFFGVIDGTSAVNFDNGELTTKTILETFYSAKEEELLEKVILRANRKLANLWQRRKIPLGRSDFLPGAVFVFIKIGPKKVEIIQGGDCFAVIEKKNGKIITTKNQAFKHVSEHLMTIANLMKKYRNRQKMWQEFEPILARSRLRDANRKTDKGFCVLNGQAAMKKFWQKIVVKRDQVKLMLLFTDGLIYYLESKNENLLAKKILDAYKAGGFEKILKRTRNLEDKVKFISHIDHAEATALALTF